MYRVTTVREHAAPERFLQTRTAIRHSLPRSMFPSRQVTRWYANQWQLGYQTRQSSPDHQLAVMVYTGDSQNFRTEETIPADDRIVWNRLGGWRLQLSHTIRCSPDAFASTALQALQ